jgi:putative tRNA adenosine deaminase-associated protein
LLADLGVPEQEMQLIVDDEDLYPDEQLARIAQRCGFGDAFAAVLEKV